MTIDQTDVVQHPSLHTDRPQEASRSGESRRRTPFQKTLQESTSMSNIDETLKERGSRYGEFADHAEIVQNIKDAMAVGKNWPTIDDDMKEALEMVAHKIGRILNGDPYYIDSWTDIIGYTRLVEKRLINEQTGPTGDRLFSEEAIAAAVADFDGRDAECQCPVCLAEQDWIAKIVGAMNTKPTNPAKPSNDEVEAALNVLLAAGVITAVEEDGDA